MSNVKINIDGRSIEAQEGSNVLEACLAAGIYVPHLCYHPDLRPRGYCGLCVVDINGMQEPVSACMTPVADGMAVTTQSERLAALRRAAMEYILAAHPEDCGTCVKYLNCELQALKQYFSIDKVSIPRRPRLFAVDSGNPLFVIDPNRCVLCGRCLRACHELRQVGVLYRIQTESEPYIGTATGLPLAEAGCRFCGACAEVCPTGAILDKNELTAGKGRKAALLPCRHACPAEIDVPGYLRFIREGDFSSAAALIREKVPFPQVLGYVCNRPCEGECRRGLVNQPVSIRDLKRFAAENDKERSWRDRLVRQPATGRRAAVVGSGPAGLTAAYLLALQGHAVTVFEALPEAGGMLRYGIPRYRLPADVLDSEIEDIRDVGVEIRTDARIESLDGLLAQDYHAVLVAVGTHQGQRLPLPGAGHPGVLLGVEFLREVNLAHRVDLGRNVLVLGGGNVAFDCARVARRLGADQVRIACLEPLEALPAAAEEVPQAQEEGIEIYPSRSFVRVVIEDGNIRGVECRAVTSFEFDDEKNLNVETEQGSEHVLPADTVILATGQQPDIPEGFGLNLRSNGLVELDEFTLETGREATFAAGDAVDGTSSVIRAIASGRRAAQMIDRFLGGSGEFDTPLAPEQKAFPAIGPGHGFASATRAPDQNLPADVRARSFCPVAASLEEGAACAESARCLQCDLRLKIKQVKFWSNYEIGTGG